MFFCKKGRTDGRTHTHTHDIASPWAPVGAKNIFFRKQDFIIWVGYYSSVCSNLLLKAADTRKLSYSNVVSSIKLYTQIWIWKLLPVQFYKSLVQNCKSNNPVLLIIKKECISQTIHIYLNRLKFSAPISKTSVFRSLCNLAPYFDLSCLSLISFVCINIFICFYSLRTEIRLQKEPKAKKQHFWNSFAF